MKTALGLLFLLTAAGPLAAQELTALAGATDTDDHTQASYGWQAELSQPLGRHLAAGLAWINEGHVPEHHRDGLAGQLWLTSSPWHALYFELGAGPYLYFDTEPNDDARGFSNNHGIGLVGSAAVVFAPPGRWTLRLNFNEIHTISDFGTRSAMLGVGYRFGSSEAPGGQEMYAAAPHGAELQVLGGETIRNGLGADESSLFGVDAQSGNFLRRFSGAATWLHLPGAPTAANRVAAQLRVEERPGNSRVSFELGVGGYFSPGSIDGAGPTASRPAGGILLLRSSLVLTQRMSMVANWFRTFTDDDRDRDLIALGLAWRFGRD